MKKAGFSVVCLSILTPALMFNQTQGRGNDENKAKDEALIRNLLSHVRPQCWPAPEKDK